MTTLNILGFSMTLYNLSKTEGLCASFSKEFYTNIIVFYAIEIQCWGLWILSVGCAPPPITTPVIKGKKYLCAIFFLYKKNGSMF